jgi:hypothetical protein
MEGFVTCAQTALPYRTENTSLLFRFEFFAHPEYWKLRNTWSGKMQELLTEEGFTMINSLIHTNVLNLPLHVGLFRHSHKLNVYPHLRIHKIYKILECMY